MNTKTKAIWPEATITILDETGVEAVKNEKIGKEPMVFDQPVANVGVNGGLTINLGNYSSMRVDISLTLPCYVGEIDACFDIAHKWVDERLEGIHNGIQESGKISHEG